MAMVCLNDFEEYAKGHLSKAVWDYYAAGADECCTRDDNLMAFKRYCVLPLNPNCHAPTEHWNYDLTSLPMPESACDLGFCVMCRNVTPGLQCRALRSVSPWELHLLPSTVWPGMRVRQPLPEVRSQITMGTGPLFIESPANQCFNHLSKLHHFIINTHWINEWNTLMQFND